MIKNMIYKCFATILGALSCVLVYADVISMSSGFVISADGMIATELSAVKDAKDLVIYGLSTNLSEAYRADIVQKDDTNNVAILKVAKYIPFKAMTIGSFKSNDTLKVVYDRFSVFKNEVLISNVVVLSEEGKFVLKDELESSAIGAAVVNMKNELVGIVAKNEDGKINKLVEISKVPQVKNDNAEFFEVLPLACAVVAYDERVELIEDPVQFSVETQDVDTKRTNIIERLGLEMIEVEGGSFMMGCEGKYSDCQTSEFPVHEVKLDSFKLSKFEVTQRQWNLVMETNPSPIKGDDLPVYNVSYDDVQEFIKKINQIAGTNFRLPTEAEWEFAAKGGVKSKGLQYAGSNNLDEVAWYRDNAGAKPHKVGTKKPNELGLYDMCGNVSEWCVDDYKSYSAPDYKPFYYSKFVDLDIPDTMIVAVKDSFALYKIDESEKLSNKLTKDRKVMRGSGYFYEKARCNLSYRRACAPTDKYTFGFRLAE